MADPIFAVWMEWNKTKTPHKELFFHWFWCCSSGIAFCMHSKQMILYFIKNLKCLNKNKKKNTEIRTRCLTSIYYRLVKFDHHLYIENDVPTLRLPFLLGIFSIFTVCWTNMYSEQRKKRKGFAQFFLRLLCHFFFFHFLFLLVLQWCTRYAL